MGCTNEQEAPKEKWRLATKQPAETGDPTKSVGTVSLPQG